MILVVFVYVCVRLLFDNALQGAVAGVLDDNYETGTRFSPFLCTCVFYTCSLPYWLFVIRTVCHQNRSCIIPVPAGVRSAETIAV